MRPFALATSALLSLAALAASPAAAAGKDTLAIVAVETAGYASTDNASEVQDAMTSAIVNDGRVRLVERQDLRRVMKEQALSQSGAMGDEVKVKVGQLLGAKWVAAVRVRADGAGVTLQANVLETSSGTVSAAEKVTTNVRELEAGARKLATLILNRLTGSTVVVHDFDPAQVVEAGRGLSRLLAGRFPVLEGKVVDTMPTGTATCQLPAQGGFEGQRFEIVGYDEITEQNQRKGLFLLTSYDSNLCGGRLKVESGVAVEPKDKLKSLPIKIALDGLEAGEGAEAAMVKQLLEETKAFLKLVPQFELTSSAEAQLTTVARITGPRGKRAIQVQVVNAKTGSTIRQLDLVGAF
jgi:hypothetical protein